jgi:hypothetical protein
MISHGPMRRKIRWFLSTESVGVRRLSLVCGIMAAIVGFLNPNYPWKRFEDWGTVLATAIVCAAYFLAAWVPIRVVDWIVAGFRADRVKKSN